MRLRNRLARLLDRLACRVRPFADHRCDLCGSPDIVWKAHVLPNKGLRIVWVADDPDDVWCCDCESWGVGSYEVTGT